MHIPSSSIALRAIRLQHPRDGDMLGAVLHTLAALIARWRAWSEASRRASEAERWLAHASDRDLADIGLARARPGAAPFIPWDMGGV